MLAMLTLKAYPMYTASIVESLSLSPYICANTKYYSLQLYSFDLRESASINILNYIFVPWEPLQEKFLA